MYLSQNLSEILVRILQLAALLVGHDVIHVVYFQLSLWCRCDIDSPFLL